MSCHDSESWQDYSGQDSPHCLIFVINGLISIQIRSACFLSLEYEFTIHVVCKVLLESWIMTRT